MADIRRLDGTVIDAVKPLRDERIAALLTRLSEMNDRGELTAIVAVHLTPQATHGVDWTLPLQDLGYPWGLVIRGALVLAQHTIGNSVIAVSAPEKH